MKIKNILTLGLIAAVAGISTAQTYNATAGTNGTADIQSDYSVATGDGASVSVDVPLEFELPKKVAIAVTHSGVAGLPANELFQDVVLAWEGSSTSQLLNLTPYNSTSQSNKSTSYVSYQGSIYANTAISVTFEATDFIHETDPNSVFKAANRLAIHDKSTIDTKYFSMADNNDSATSQLPFTHSIDDTEIATSGNKLGFFSYSRAYLDTIDPTDRAGKYLSVQTITVSTL